MPFATLDYSWLSYEKSGSSFDYQLLGPGGGGGGGGKLLYDRKVSK